MNRTSLWLALALMLPALAPSAVDAASRGLEARDLATLDRFGAPTLSKDGRYLVFTKRVVDFAANKASTSLWIEDLRARDAAPPKRLTPDGWNVNSPAFSPDGKTVYFLSAKSGSQQLYAMPAIGGEPKALTELPLDIGAYKLSPDGKRVAVSLETFADCKSDLACTKKKLDDTAARKSSGVLYDKIFVRHWDTWADGRLSRLFVAKLPQGKEKPAKTATLVGADVLGDVPSKPFVGAVRAHRRPHRTHQHQFRSLPRRRRRQRQRAQPYRSQQSLGHRPGVLGRRQNLVLPRDEAAGLRGRSFRVDGDGSGRRRPARARAALGRFRRRLGVVGRRRHDLHHCAGTWAASLIRRVPR
jgi:dipeptidyl aminopeptidase/acylaminoacyl peptidase